MMKKFLMMVAMVMVLCLAITFFAPLAFSQIHLEI